MKKLTRTLRRNHIAAAIALTLGSLTPVWADEPARSFVDMVEKVALVPAGTHNSEMLAKVTSAVGFIKQMDLPRAHLAANEALQLDPRNSYLHFLNGFIYHLQALQGDTQKSELALEGYQQSLRIDSSNRHNPDTRHQRHNPDDTTRTPTTTLDRNNGELYIQPAS